MISGVMAQTRLLVNLDGHLCDLREKFGHCFLLSLDAKHKIVNLNLSTVMIEEQHVACVVTSLSSILLLRNLWFQSDVMLLPR